MKPCDDFDMRAYLDGELEGEPRAAHEAHLASCEQCREEVEDLRKVLALLRAAPDVAVSPNFTARVLTEIAAPVVLARAAFRTRSYALAASFLLLCAAGAIVYVAMQGGNAPAELADEEIAAAPAAPEEAPAPAPAAAEPAGAGGLLAEEPAAAALPAAGAPAAVAKLRRAASPSDPAAGAEETESVGDLRGEGTPAAEEPPSMALGKATQKAESARTEELLDDSARESTAAAALGRNAPEPAPKELWVALPESPETVAKLTALGVENAGAGSRVLTVELDGERALKLSQLAGPNRWGVEGGVQLLAKVVGGKASAARAKKFGGAPPALPKELGAPTAPAPAPAPAAPAPTRARGAVKGAGDTTGDASTGARALDREAHARAGEEAGAPPAPPQTAASKPAPAAEPAHEAAKSADGALRPDATPEKVLESVAPVEKAAAGGGGSRRKAAEDKATALAGAPPDSKSPAAPGTMLDGPGAVRYRILILLLPPEELARVALPGQPAPTQTAAPSEALPAKPAAPAPPSVPLAPQK